MVSDPAQCRRLVLVYAPFAIDGLTERLPKYGVVFWHAAGVIEAFLGTTKDRWYLEDPLREHGSVLYKPVDCQHLSKITRFEPHVRGIISDEDFRKHGKVKGPMPDDLEERIVAAIASNGLLSNVDKVVYTARLGLPDSP